MVDRNYFEEVLPDQLRAFELSSTVTLTLTTGAVFNVRSVFAAHDRYVVMEVYPPENEEMPERSEAWQQAHPAEMPWIFDQLVAPYDRIASVHLTVRHRAAVDERPIGFER